MRTALLRVYARFQAQRVFIDQVHDMKLLFVTAHFPYPPRTGHALIAYHYIKHLALRHSIDLISYGTHGRLAEAVEFRAWCNHIELVDQPSRRETFFNAGLGIAARQPFEVPYYKSAKMFQAVHRHLSRGGYDAALFQRTETVQFLPADYVGPAIWCMEDPPGLREQRLLSLSPWYSRPAIQDRISRLRRYVRRQAIRFDRVLVLSEADARDYESTLKGARLDWVPYGIDTDVFKPGQANARREGMILISGNMYHPPNVDAVEYFCRRVFPLVCQRAPSANLWIVGAEPAASVRKWSENKRIKVTGFVPDLRAYLSQAMVSVCAVRLKIGAQTKILEALACGTPVVTTSAGNNSTGGVSGEHLYVADEPAEFAERVVALLNHERWTALSENGRQFVTANFTWEKCVAKLETILEEVCRARHGLAPFPAVN